MYRRLLESLMEAGYAFSTFEEYFLSGGRKTVILRHDVDRKPLNALRLAEIESKMGIRGSYHFRIAGSSAVPEMISLIAGLGHEVAYHYEDMTLAVRMSGKTRNITVEGLATRAFESFSRNLAFFRKFYPVRIISMHGSPTEKTDNRLVWKYFDYHECDVLCEPYFDLDYSDMLYLTDTGRRWDGDRFNIRDKALISPGDRNPDRFEAWKVKPVRGSLINMTNEALNHRARYLIHSTKEFISLAESGALPGKIVVNTHPQRWNDSLVPWMNELYIQFLKNQIKRIVIRFSGGRTIN